MTPQLLRAAGESLYGARWQTALAADLGVSRRAVIHWSRGTRGLPADLPERLRCALVGRTEAIRGVLEKLGRAGKQE